MSAEEQIPVVTATEDVKAAKGSETAAITTEPIVEQERAEKILKAKELYSHGSRNYLVKSYAEAADELSQVCALYEELYGEQSDELGMPYLLYAKSLIALALDENKVIDVPDEEELEDDDDVDEDDDGGEEENGEAAPKSSAESKNGKAAEASSSNGATPKVALESVKEKDGEEKAEADSTETETIAAAATTTKSDEEKTKPAEEVAATESATSTADGDKNEKENGEEKEKENGTADKSASSSVVAKPVLDGEKPSTSNGDAEAGEEDDEEENEAASNLQLAWEILELAAKIFLRQGTNGLPNLAEVQTELANIEFENNLPEAAREDYVRALKIYSELPTNYRRAMAEIHYKIGLTYLMQQLNKEGAESLKDACTLIDAEIKEMQEGKEELSEKQKNVIQDMEETKQEIWAKIAEIEDTQAQNIAEVRAALDSYIKPINSEHKNDAEASSSSSSSAAKAAAGASSSSVSSSAKPTDISHLIKRKKPDEQGCEADSTASPAKRAAV